MSSIRLKHPSGNAVIIAGPSSNPAANRTLTLPGDSDGVIAKTDADGNITMGDFASPTDLNTAQVPTLFVDRVDNNIFGEDGALYITQNAYFSNSGSYKRVTTARPLQYKQRLGKHKFLVGDSGSAGGNVTFSEAVIMDADGLKFNGDTSSANALNDYEEGTWTPTFQNVSAPNYNSRAGKYTKIGRFVFLTGELFVASGLDTSDASAIAIGGLPFTPAATHNAALFEFGADVSLVTQSGLEGFTNVNMTTSLVALLRGSANLAYSQCNSSGNLKFALSYET